MKNIFTFKMIKVAGIVMSVVLGLGAMSPAMAATDFVAGDVKTAFIGGSATSATNEVFNETSEGVWESTTTSTTYTQSELDNLLDLSWIYDAGTEEVLYTQSDVDTSQNADTTFSNDLTAAVLGNLTFNTTTGLYEADGDIQNLVDAINTAILANKSGIAGLVAIDNFTQAEFATFNSTNSTAIADALDAAKLYADQNDSVLSASDVNNLITKVTLTTLLGSDTYDSYGSAAAAQSAAEQYADLNDANTQLSDSAVVTIITDSAIFQATLTQAQLDSFTAMTTDTNLSDSAVVAIISTNGGFQTTLTQAQLDSFTAMTTDTNTQLTDAQVRALIGVAGDLSYNATTGVISFSQRTDSAVEVLARNAIDVSGDLSYNALTGVISFTGRTDAQVTALANTAGDARIAAALLSGSILSSSDIASAISTAITNAAAGTSTAADGVQNTAIEANAGAIAALQGVDNLTQAEFDAINFDVVSTEDGRLNDLIVANSSDISGLDTRLDTAEGAITVLNGSGVGSVEADIADAISAAATAADIGSFESVAAVTAVAEVVEVLAVAEVLYVAPVAAVAGVTGVAEVLGSITGTYTNGGLVITFTINETSEGVWYEGTTPRDQSVVAGYLANSTTTLSDGSTISNVTGSLGTTEVIAVTEVIGVAEVLYVAPVAYVAGVAEVIGTEGTFTGTGELGEVALAITNEQAARIAADAALSGRIDTNATDIAANAADLVTETAARIAADSSATTDRSAIRSEFASADSAIQADVDQNEADADAAIAALTSTVASNETASNAADTTLSAAILAETNARIAAIIAVQADVDANEVASIAADIVLQTGIDGETATRIAEDIILQAAIDANEAAIDAEKARAEAAELVLRTAIAAETTRVGSFNQSGVDAAIASAAANAAADSVDAFISEANQMGFVAASLVKEAVARAQADAMHDIKLAIHEGRLNDIDVILADHEARISFLESLHVVDKSFSKVIDGPNGTKIVMHFDADGTQRGKARTLTFLENPVVHGEFDILWNDEGKAVNAITGKLVDPMTGLEFDEMAGFSAAAVEDVNVFFGDMFITPKTNTTPFDTAFVAEEVAPVAPFSLDAGTFVLPSSASKVGSK